MMHMHRDVLSCMLEPVLHMNEYCTYKCKCKSTRTQIPAVEVRLYGIVIVLLRLLLFLLLDQPGTIQYTSRDR